MNESVLVERFPIQIDGKEVVLTLNRNNSVFQPNLTTRYIGETVVSDLDAIKKDPERYMPRTALDLGCGIGPIAIILKKAGIPIVHASDVLGDAVDYAAINSGINHEQIYIHISDLFKSLGSMKFDLIVSDVSGMREDLSRMSPWYPEKVPSGGIDGADKAVAVLEQAKHYMTSDGCLYFPVISLANTERIIDAANKNFQGLDHKVSVDFPLHPSLTQHLDYILALQEAGDITLQKKGSRYLWKLDVWRAYDPKD